MRTARAARSRSSAGAADATVVARRDRPAARGLPVRRNAVPDADRRGWGGDPDRHHAAQLRRHERDRGREARRPLVPTRAPPAAPRGDPRPVLGRRDRRLRTDLDGPRPPLQRGRLVEPPLPRHVRGRDAARPQATPLVRGGRARPRLEPMSRPRRHVGVRAAPLPRRPGAGPLLGPKCVVVSPSVPRRDDAHARHLRFLEERPPGGALELLFVGVQFFRKGGEFVLDALEPLARGAHRRRLTIVSSFETDGYATPSTPSACRGAGAHRGAAVGARPRPPRARAVREPMATTHVLLFPTLDETFGFVAAEALATGLAVVTAATSARSPRSSRPRTSRG